MGKKSREKRNRNNRNDRIADGMTKEHQEFTKEYPKAEIITSLNSPRELAKFGAESETRGMKVEFIEKNGSIPWMARSRYLPGLSGLYTSKAKSYHYDFDILSRCILKRPDIEQLRSQLRLADHRRGIFLEMRNHYLNHHCSCGAKLPESGDSDEEGKESDEMRQSGECEGTEEGYRRMLDELTRNKLHPRFLVQFCLKGYIVSQFAATGCFDKEISKSNMMGVLLLDDMLKYNSERVLFMQKYTRLTDSGVPSLRCACILKQNYIASQSLAMIETLEAIDISNDSKRKMVKPQKHVHCCARLECPNVETLKKNKQTKKCRDPQAKPNVPEKVRRFQVCRSCKAAKTRVRAYYCSVQCHRDDWQFHFMLHRLFNEPTEKYPAGHRRCFDD